MMKDGIPLVYWVFRWAWSVLHLIILAVLLIVFLAWALTDNQGANAFSAWLDWIQQVRSTLGNAIPYPWG